MDTTRKFRTKPSPKIGVLSACIILLSALCLLPACSGSGGASGSATMVSDSQAASAASSTNAADAASDPSGKDAILDRAKQCLGLPYKYGGCSRDGMDESGLVSYCCTGDWKRICTAASCLSWTHVENPQAGDICSDGTTCGVYAGDGAMISVTREGGVVCMMSVPSGMTYVEYSG